MNEIVERYLAAWNETDAVKRRSLVDGLWAADARYTDPLADAHGRAEIDGRSAGRWTRTTTRPGSAGTWGPRGRPSRS
jgi:hypothetical protein